MDKCKNETGCPCNQHLETDWQCVAMIALFRFTHVHFPRDYRHGRGEHGKYSSRGRKCRHGVDPHLRRKLFALSNLCEEPVGAGVSKKQLFLWGSWAMVLSLPCMILASSMGFRIHLNHDWWWLGALTAFLLASFGALMVRSQFVGHERRVLLLFFLFAGWWEVTVVLLTVSSGVLVYLAYVAGFFIAALALYHAQRIPPASPEAGNATQQSE
jgi:hypothetical protein